MASFKYKHTEILSLISQCKKEGLISDEERKIMKKFIVNNEPDLSLELGEYEKDQDLRKLVETLKVMSEITLMSSPVDNNLIDIKKKKRKKMGKKNSSENKERDIVLGNCDIGVSPTLNFTKKFDKNDNEYE